MAGSAYGQVALAVVLLPSEFLQLRNHEWVRKFLLRAWALGEN